MNTATATVDQVPVELWRFERLRAAGCPTPTAMALAASQHVDLHTALGLLAEGCPAQTALNILL